MNKTNTVSKQKSELLWPAIENATRLELEFEKLRLDSEIRRIERKMCSQIRKADEDISGIEAVLDRCRAVREAVGKKLNSTAKHKKGTKKYEVKND